jgi:hypothetical protein
LKGNKRASDTRRSELGVVHGDQHRESTDTHSSEPTTSCRVRLVTANSSELLTPEAVKVASARLKRRAHHEDYAPTSNGVLPSQHLWW